VFAKIKALFQRRKPLAQPAMRAANQSTDTMLNPLLFSQAIADSPSATSIDPGMTAPVDVPAPAPVDCGSTSFDAGSSSFSCDSNTSF